MDSNVSKFNEYIVHKDEVIAKAARELSELERLLSEGAISISEFNEIADDILELKDINSLANNIERKQLLDDAFAALSIIASIVGAGS